MAGNGCVRVVILITAASASRVPHSGGSCLPFARRHLRLLALARAWCSYSQLASGSSSFTSCPLHFLACGYSLAFTPRLCAWLMDGLSIRVHGVFNSIVGQSNNGTLVLVRPLASLDMRGCHANSAWRLHLRHMRPAMSSGHNCDAEALFSCST